MLRFKANKSTSNIIVNLWSDQHRDDDISVENECPHISVDNDICTSCGSFVGKWGYEKKIWDFYKHSMMFVYNQPCDVHIITPKIIPPELKVSDFSILDSMSNRYRQIIFSKESGLLINSFYKKPIYNPYVFNNKRVIDWLVKDIINSDSVFLNPSVNEYGFNIMYKHINKRLQHDKWYQSINKQ